MLCLPIHGAPRNVRYGSEADTHVCASRIRFNSERRHSSGGCVQSVERAAQVVVFSLNKKWPILVPRGGLRQFS